MNAQFTRKEIAVINAAYDAICQVCDVSHADNNADEQAVKLERAQVSPVQDKPVIWARARVVKYWYEGAMSGHVLTAQAICHYRPGVIAAILLGASHADRLEHGSDTRRNRHALAVSRAPDAIAAYEAQSARLMDSLR